MTSTRRANRADAEAIRDTHLSAFPEGERERIARLAVDLLLEETTSRTLSLVAEADCGIIGHAAFSPVATDDANGLRIHILAPLAVRPGFRKQGIGSQLVAEGIRRLTEGNGDILLVYGDPEYYGRFGFRADVAERFLPPYALEYPFGWQGMVLGGHELENPPLRIRCVPSLSDPALW